MGQAPDRQAALFAGLPTSVPCTAVNKVIFYRGGGALVSRVFSFSTFVFNHLRSVGVSRSSIENQSDCNQWRNQVGGKPIPPPPTCFTTDKFSSALRIISNRISNCFLVFDQKKVSQSFLIYSLKKNLFIYYFS